MKKLLVFLSSILLGGLAFLPAQDQGDKGKDEAQPKAGKAKDVNTRKATTTRGWRPVSHHPDGGHITHFSDRASMRGNDKAVHFKLEAGKKNAVQLPIDWVKTIPFPMDLNDTYGDCYYAAGCHMDNLWTGNAGTESQFSLSAIKSRYFALSGGDNGLGDSDMQGEMMNRYLADLPAAKIISWANVDPNNAEAVQTAIQRYGCVAFTFVVANNWINNSDTGAVWDASTFRANNNGHAVVLGGVDKDGKYKLLTWGTYMWITPAGVRVCDPGAWAAFSVRWFDSHGYAPNKMHITELAKQWKADTGKEIPEGVVNAFPPPGDVPPPVPPPTPTPPPAPGSMNQMTLTINGVTSQWELFPLGTRQKLRELRDIIGPIAP